MTREEIEKAIETLETESCYECAGSAEKDEEGKCDCPLVKAQRIAVQLLERELQFLDAGYKNQSVEFYIGGRKFMVKEMAQ